MASLSLPQRLPGRSGFTLVELLVVIAIIIVLIGMLLPAVQEARATSYKAKCQNNLKQLGIACHAIHDVMGALPPGGVNLSADCVSSTSDKGSWMVYLLPYMEANDIFSQVTGLTTLGVNSISPISNMRKPWMICPADPFNGQINTHPSFANSNYAGSGGPMNGRLYGCTGCGPGGTNITACTDPFSPVYASRPDLGYTGSQISARSNDPKLLRGVWARPDNSCPGIPVIEFRFTDITDGLSTTLLIGETLPNQNRYSVDGSSFSASPQGMVLTTIIPLNTYTPIPNPSDAADCNLYGTKIFGNWGYSAGFKSQHAGGVNFVFGDGSVHFLSQTINMDTLQLLGCRNDGHVPKDPNY